jgi:hypothetical protein
MKVLKIILLGILLLIIFRINVYSQFHIIPYVELETNFENGYLSRPSKIMLVGREDAYNNIYIVKMEANKNNYSIYNVKPGKYLIAINDSNGGIFYQYQVLTLYDTEKQYFESEIKYLNEINIKDEKKLKLKINFKMNNAYSGFQKVYGKDYENLNYLELIYYSKSPKKKTYKNSAQSRMSTNSASNVSDCENGSICGSNTGTCKKDLNFKCNMDNGNINITIDAAYFENMWCGETASSTRIGDTVLGTQNADLTWNCGVTDSKVYLLDDGNNPHPGEWPTFEVNSQCQKNIDKCKLEFNYNIGLVMETSVWNKDQMCKTIKSYQEKPLCDNQNSNKSKCFCDCYLEAVIEHESTHCKSWMEATDKIKTELDKYCEGNQNKFTAEYCCSPNDAEVCQQQAERIKYLIFSDLVKEVVNKVYEDKLNSPENTSNVAEKRKFNSCTLSKHCDAL